MITKAVINSGPLIALTLVERLDLLPALFNEFWIPEAVYQEVAIAGFGRPGSERLDFETFGKHIKPSPEPDPLLVYELDRGEAAVITLARFYAPCLAVIDEKRGRRIAQTIYGLPVKGSVGLLVEAQRRGLLADLRSTLVGLKTSGYFLSDALIEAACRAAINR